MAPLDVVQAEAEAATRRQALAQAEATAQTAELTLKRLIVNGTDDPLWRAQHHAGRSPDVPRPSRSTSKRAVRKAPREADATSSSRAQDRSRATTSR